MTQSALPEALIGPEPEVDAAFDDRAARDGAVPANPTVAGAVASSLPAPSPAASSAPRAHRSAKAPWFSARAAHSEDQAPSNLDTAFAVSDRALATPPRLRDSVTGGAFNLAQLAAAIVVGIVIGKGAHLLMDEGSARAWVSTAGVENGLRPEPSRTVVFADDVGAKRSAGVESAASRDALTAFDAPELELEPAPRGVAALNAAALNAAALNAAAPNAAAPNAAAPNAAAPNVAPSKPAALEGGVAPQAIAADVTVTPWAASALDASAALELDDRRAAVRRRVGSRGRAAARVNVRPSALWSRSGARQSASRVAVSLSAVERAELGANAAAAVPCTVAEPPSSLALSSARLPMVHGAGRRLARPLPAASSAAASSSNVGLPAASPSACAAPVAALLAPHVAGLARSYAANSYAANSYAANSHAAGADPVSVRVPLLEPSSDDWLGEQLAILARAERGLLEGDPEGAVRSLDEYQARFPNGLLDPQMASVRQRIEDRFTAFIFP